MKRKLPDTSRFSPVSGAFTLVELLMVIVIISILAGLSLTTVSYTQREARIYRTRSTIKKLDAAIADIYDRYDFRKIGLPSAWTGLSTQDQGRFELMTIRDTIRLEMPQNWYEVMDFNDNSFPSAMSVNRILGTNGGSNIQNYPATSILTDQPPVHRYYQRAFISARNRLTAAGMSVSDADDLILENGSAELLFLIIANLNPTALENFAGPEIGDTDGDGLMEFIDSWGNPIEFFRWAPGLIDSERQPKMILAPGQEEVNRLRDRFYDPLDFDFSGAFVADRNGLNLGDAPTKYITHRGWYLCPVIVSRGPDGGLGLRKGTDEPVGTGADFQQPVSYFGETTNYLHSYNPFDTINGKGDDMSSWLGAPVDKTYLDNIHNHQR